MVTSETRDLRARIVRGEVDPNNSSLFFADAIKASILFLNDKIKLRDKRVPHFILNTGDDILYRELMNYSYSKTEITDEDFVYNEIPRGIITVNDINTLPDQLTQPYVRGYFEIEDAGQVYEFSAETRRMPVQSTIGIKYYLDSFTDCLALSQYLITTLCYVRTFQFDYMGNAVMCSLKFPDAFSSDIPSSITFDSESKYKSIAIELTLETNLPIFDGRTAVETSAIIRTTINGVSESKTKLQYPASIRGQESYKYRTGTGWIYWFSDETPRPTDMDYSGTLLYTMTSGKLVHVPDDTYEMDGHKYRTENGYVVEVI